MAAWHCRIPSRLNNLMVYNPESMIKACLMVSVLCVGVVWILKSSESSTINPSRYHDTGGGGSPVNSTLTTTFDPSVRCSFEKIWISLY